MTVEVVASDPLAILVEIELFQLVDNQTLLESNRKPAPPTANTANPLVEFEFGNLAGFGFVPKNDLIRWVVGTPAAAYKEKQR